MPVPKKRAARKRKRDTIASLRAALQSAFNEIDHAHDAIEALIDDVKALTNASAEAFDSLQERTDALEALQGITSHRGASCDCENCRLRWN